MCLFNASKRGDALLSRVDGSNTFTSVRASALRVQPIAGDFAMFAEIAGQYAFNDLLSDEEFDVGGTRFGRGYDNKELSADHGLGFTAELQHTSRPDMPYLDRLQFFGFYDIGKVWDRGSSFNASLSSAGGGVRLWLWDNEVSLGLQLAKPLTRRSQRASNSREMELLFRALAQF